MKDLKLRGINRFLRDLEKSTSSWGSNELMRQLQIEPKINNSMKARVLILKEGLVDNEYTDQSWLDIYNLALFTDFP